MLFISVFFIRPTHAFSMGLTLFTQTMLICIPLGFCNLAFWFSYILFIIFLGGMLVLFIDVASLASNEFYSSSSNYIYMSLFISLFIGFCKILNHMLFPNSSL